MRTSRSTTASYANHLVDIPVDPGLDALPSHHLPGNSPPSSDDGQADADGDYFPGQNDGLAQQIYAEAQPQGQGEEVNAGYYAPDGFRFCSGCRSNKKLDDFHDGRKMCYRHRKLKSTDVPAPEAVSVEDLRVRLKAKSAEDGVSKFDASIDLSTLPGQEDVEFELSNVIVGAALVNPGAKPLDSAAENMRQARVRVKPLVNLILEATGYSFVYKDCREGRKQKYSYSLRYLCAQRADQDGTKRRSAALATPAPEPRPPTPPPLPEPLDQTDTDGQIHAAILAMVQANTTGNVGDAYAIPVGPEIPEAGPSGMSEMGGSQSGMDVDGSVEDDDEKGGKGRRGKGWRKGLGKAPDPNKKPPVKRVTKEGGKPRAPQKKMERYECKGCLVVNLFAGTDTAHFTISHLLQHPEYVDIVGNRVRGPRFVPPPIPLSTTLEDPVGTIEIGDESDPPPPLERVERTFHAMLDLIKVLKTKKHGGEDEVVRALYEKSEEVRRYRVSVSEAIARNAKGKDKLKEKLEASRKRKRDPNDGDDEGRRERPAHEEDVMVGGMSQQQVDEVMALTALTTGGVGQEEMVVQFLQRTAEQEAAEGERAVEEAVAKTVAQTWMGQLDPALGGGL